MYGFSCFNSIDAIKLLLWLGKVKEGWGDVGESMTSSYINYYWWIYRQNISICPSINNSVSISDTSLYGFPCLNPIIISSVKSFTKKLYIIVLFGFLKISFIPTGIPLIFTKWIFLSVNTDGFGEGINSIGKYHPKIQTDFFYRDFVCIHKIS